VGNPNHRPAGDGCYDNKDGFIAFENNASPTKVHEVHVKLNAIAGPLRDTRLRKSVIVDVGTVPENTST
jgi:hypothetical protein